ncbi:ATP-binding cassette domain-containing protein [Sorangium sp. So ce448]|uniref:ATP-binding cassette domain-containing protein n=1 Tax=Sorangium sp. So ce448 TaxID=3133314 RepID=UPI003F62BE9E
MTSTPDLPALLAMRGIVKRFPGVTALSGVSLSLRAGEVLALVGENGAGKSTLMKILGGACQPDEGQIFIDGAPVSLSGVRAAKRLVVPGAPAGARFTALRGEILGFAGLVGSGAALAAEGITLLMVSSDMEEVLGMSDRVVVMHERRITGVLPREGLTQQRVAALMTGSARGAEGDVENAVTA